ncbi:MAG TPA: hypothetical protein VE642_12790 [Pyrinomonadaceae bacterium]|jgi:hypothetical protein|nr:hypothetical protein [Pyrinomonadaceae bacterium]
MAVAQRRRPRAGEAGGSRLNFIIVMVILALATYSAYNYAPVAYDAFLFKDFMEETVNKAAFPPGQTPEWVAQQLRAQAKEYDLPADMNINVQMESGHIVARAQWTRPVRLPGYTYQYQFDHTAQSSGFINPQ